MALAIKADHFRNGSIASVWPDRGLNASVQAFPSFPARHTTATATFMRLRLSAAPFSYRVLSRSSKKGRLPKVRMRAAA
jgi:hypothetical protein